MNTCTCAYMLRFIWNDLKWFYFFPLQPKYHMLSCLNMPCPSDWLNTWLNDVNIVMNLSVKLNIIVEKMISSHDLHAFDFLFYTRDN